MTNTDVISKQQRAHAKKRNWRDGAGAGGPFVRAPSPYARHHGGGGGGAFDGGVAAAASALLAKYRSFSSLNKLSNSNNNDSCMADAFAVAVAPPPSMVDVVPPEMVALVLAFLDGQSLLNCSTVCRTMATLSHNRDVWKTICLKTWPTLRTQVLPQLPGAPDYDLVRLYGGSWRRCFVERHRLDQRVEMQVEIPHFSTLTGVEKVVSEPFSIGEHRFCLWIFPNGNPNEPQYVGRVLSVYLVLTDLDRRAPDWLTCAVFSLAVVNHQQPHKKIEWHSCLVDNKFTSQLNNWGVHSLGSLKTLRNPASGFLQTEQTQQTESLTVTANVRLMTITFRVVFEKDLQTHRRLGLADFPQADTLVLPFCCSLQDLLTKLNEVCGVDTHTVRVWCFNQPVVSGQALRPRKRLTQQIDDATKKTLPLFGNLLCDGVDIDAYSFCQLYIDCPDRDAPPLNGQEAMGVRVGTGGLVGSFDVDMDDEPHGSQTTVGLPESNSVVATATDATTTATDTTSYIFVKLMDPQTLELVYLGRFAIFQETVALLATSWIYEAVARRLGCSSYELAMFKEEIAPTVYSGPIAWSNEPIGLGSSALQPAEIVVFTHTTTVASGAFAHAMHAQLVGQYHAAEQMLAQEWTCPTLEQIERLAERLDIPKFRIRSAFRKCHEDGRTTLKYIMEGRHLGFICDSCGETDFKGPRFNCTVCSDYDLCTHCHAKSQDVNHRYANVDGKWQRVYDFKDHKSDHTMREMLPVFVDYERRRHLHQHGEETSQVDVAAAW